MAPALIELLKRLKNGKPEKVEKRGDNFEYHATDGSTTTVAAPVHNLYNNGTVNNFIFNFAAPAERPDIEGIKTYLKYAEDATVSRSARRRSRPSAPIRNPDRWLLRQKSSKTPPS